MDNEENGTQTCDQYILEQYKKLQERNENLMKMNEQLNKDKDYLSGVINFVNTKCKRKKQHIEQRFVDQYVIIYEQEGNPLPKVTGDTKANLEALGFNDNTDTFNW